MLLACHKMSTTSKLLGTSGSAAKCGVSRLFCSIMQARAVVQSCGRYKTFEQIPGPKLLPIVGNLWRYFPLIGQYKLEHLDKNGHYNLKRYGKIVREEISKSHRILHLFDPKDIESMFQQEDRFPYRRSHRALIKYRTERADKYRSGGIFPENGAEWARLRDQFKRNFLLVKNINQYDEKLNELVGDLVKMVRICRDDKSEVADFQQQLYRWALESICAIMLDTRIGCLEVNHDQNSEANRLIRAAHQTNDSVMRTEMYEGWQKRPTKDYQNLSDAQDVMAEICEKHLQKRIHSNDKPETILSQLIMDPKVDRKDLFALILDFVLAGIDTTSITAGFTLYYLAKHESIQNKVRQEIAQVVGNEPIKAEHFREMPLLKACVKETLRLRPVSIGVGRLTTKDIIINDYQIPKDTMIITQNQVACVREEYFKDALQFRPSRWLQNQNHKHRFIWLPFGHGTRMCLGRRIAELELYILICRLLRCFRVEYHYEDIDVKTMLINVPEKPMRFRFIDI